jgi:hypothetical protein
VSKPHARNLPETGRVAGQESTLLCRVILQQRDDAHVGAKKTQTKKEIYE